MRDLAEGTFGTAMARPLQADLGGRVKTGHFVDSQNRPFLASVETA